MLWLNNKFSIWTEIVSKKSNSALTGLVWIHVGPSRDRINENQNIAYVS